MHSHKEQVENIKNETPDIDELYDLADLFKVFSDSTRIRILYTMYNEPICVCGIAEALDMNQSAISHQLKTLRQAKLITGRREGKQIFYSLSDSHVKTILAQGLEHVSE